MFEDKGSRSLMHSIDSSHGGGSFFESRTSQDSKTGRRLTVVDGIAILVGIIIGSGIFSSPGLALERAGSPGVDLIAWGVSGLLVQLAAQCYMELGGIMPSAGGDFDYLTRAYGERMGFAFAWFNIFVSKTGSQAIIATIFGRYFESVILGNTDSLTSGRNDETFTSKMLAVGLITTITLINCTGIKESAFVSLILTAVKISLVLSVFVFAIIFASSGGSHSDNIIQNLSPNHSFENSNSIVNFGSAMVACLWCFDGFADGNFLMEEMINPTRDLPRIIRTGLAIVTICYILINIGYLSILSRDTIIDSKAIAVQFGESFSVLFSSHRQVLPTILALGVSLSTMGAINGSIMTGGRAFYAVARANKFPSVMARLNRFGAPWVALLVQGTWSIVLLMMPGSNFSTLLDYFGPTSWMFYALSASCVMVLRYKEPNIDRPFKVMWYPLPPILVIIIALVIFISSLISEPMYTLLAVGFVLLAFPVHLLMEYYEGKYGKKVNDMFALPTDDEEDVNRHHHTNDHKHHVINAMVRPHTRSEDFVDVDLNQSLHMNNHSTSTHHRQPYNISSNSYSSQSHGAVHGQIVHSLASSHASND